MITIPNDTKTYHYSYLITATEINPRLSDTDRTRLIRDLSNSIDICYPNQFEIIRDKTPYTWQMKKDLTERLNLDTCNRYLVNLSMLFPDFTIIVQQISTNPTYPDTMFIATNGHVNYLLQDKYDMLHLIGQHPDSEPACTRAYVVYKKDPASKQCFLIQIVRAASAQIACGVIARELKCDVTDLRAKALDEIQ